MFYVRIMQSENSATNIHTHYRQSETAPHIRALYARKISPQIYMRIAVRLESAGRVIGRWCLLRSFVSRFVSAVIVWIRSFLLIGRCQSFIVKA